MSNPINKKPDEEGGAESVDINYKITLAKLALIVLIVLFLIEA